MSVGKTPFVQIMEFVLVEDVSTDHGSSSTRSRNMHPELRLRKANPRDYAET